MNELNYSPEALSDLDEIWSYIFKDLQNPSAAENTIDMVLDNIESLQKFPEMGAYLSVITEIESDYHYLVCGSYLAFYRVIGSEVNIDRILYSGRDYLKILFGETLK